MVGTSGSCGTRLAELMRERLHLAEPPSPCVGRDRRHIHLRVAADHGGRRLRRALVGHVHDVDLGILPQDLGREERRAGDTGRGEIELAGLLLGARDEVLQAVAGKVRRRRSRPAARTHARDAGKVLHRIELDALVDGAGDGVPIRGEHQRVAVGRRLGDRRGSGQARAVLDDDLLLPHVGQLVGEDARQAVGDAAGGERDHDA